MAAYKYVRIHAQPKSAEAKWVLEIYISGQHVITVS